MGDFSKLQTMAEAGVGRGWHRTDTCEDHPGGDARRYYRPGGSGDISAAIAGADAPTGACAADSVPFSIHE